MSTYPDDCPVAAALDAVGDRWTLLIVRDLLRGIDRYSDLSRSLAPIAPNLLSERLRRLEDIGVVEREVYSDRPLRAAYRLTPVGRALAPVVITLGRFGIDHLGAPEPEYLAAHEGCGGRVPPGSWRCLCCGEQVAAESLVLRDPKQIRPPLAPGDRGAASA